MKTKNLEEEKTHLSRQRIEQFIEMISDIAALKFRKRLDVDGSNSYEDILAHGLNMLTDEWMETVTSKDKLYASEKKFTQLFENSYDAIFIFDSSTSKLLEVNKAALRLLNDEQSNFHLKPFAQLLNFESILFQDLIKDIKKEGGSTFKKDQLLLPNGNEISAEYTACLVEIEEKEILQINLRDTTERENALQEKEQMFQLMKNSEHQYRSLFESTSIGILLLEPGTGAIINSNKAMEDILGFSNNEMKKLTLSHLLPENHEAEHSVILELLQKEGKLTLETEWIARDKRLVPVETTLSMTTNAGGEPIIITNVRDISERKQAGLIRRVTYNIAKKLNTVDIELPDLCGFIQQELSEIMPAENFYIALNSGDNLKYIYIEDQFTTAQAPFYKPKGTGLNEYIINNKKVVRLVGADAADIEENNRINLYGIPPKSWLGAPIISEGECIGLVAVQSYIEHFAYTDSHEQLLSLLGTELGVFLKRAQERYERDQILSISKDLISIADFEGYFTYVNPAFTTLLGYSPEELLEKPFLEFIHPDDLDDTVNELRHLEKGDSTVITFENRYLTKNGDYRFLSWTAVPNLEEQKVYAIARDISEQKRTQDELLKSENRYRGLFEKMNEGLIYANDSGYIKMVNPSLCHMLGYTKEELIGALSYEKLHSEDISQEIQFKVQSLKEGKSETYETVFLGKNGEEVWASVNAHPLYNKAGELDGLMKVITNITERKLIELEKEAAYVKLLESDEKLRNEHQSTLVYQSMLLSSQLNPHFIFNSLNSIQYHILDQDPEPSLQFLSRFAQLMRSVLKNSTSRFITIHEEINFLRVYMELEKSRHANKFDFEIVCDEDLNPHDFYIPPMLLQPYAENSIIHGIGHLVSDGKISIHFKPKGEDQIICEIVDNGIGRKEALKRNILKEGEKDSHSSFINANRINILNRIENGGYSMEMLDLLDLDGNALGTKVIVEFPQIKEE